MSLGDTISEARRRLGYTQKYLANCIQKPDGGPITPQYLNDIEHDRRTPSSPQMIEQFAKALKVEPEVLYFEAGTLPSDITKETVEAERIVAAFRAFRKKLRS